MKRVRSAIRMLASVPFRMLPNVVRRRLLQVVFDATAAQPPAVAMRWLLEADSDLTVVINRTAMLYGGGVHAKHRLIRYHDFFVERIGKEDRVLDVGCGYGAVAHSIATRSGAHVTGIDLERKNILMARDRFPHPRLKFVEGDALIALPQERFDVIVLSNVLEHIEERIAFVRTLVAAIRPSRVLIRVPMADRDWRVPLREELGLFPYSDLGHFTEYTLGSFRTEMTEAGLEIVHVQVNWGELWAEVRPAGA